MAIENILGRLDSLISMGEDVLATRYRVANAEFLKGGSLLEQWRTSSLAFLDAVLGSK